MSRSLRLPASAYKLAVFTVTSVVLFAMIATLVGNLSNRPTRSYSALFTDATGVFKGDRVRLAGVEVGSVESVELVERGGAHLARVTFTVEDDVPLHTDARLALRYANVIGQRYLAIEESPDGRAMKPGATFGTGQTTPALNLTQLFNGFQPLFTALEPAQVNRLSRELVAALQGESGTVSDLLRTTASLTSTVADRDAVIGRVVDNLTAVLETVGGRDEKLTDLIVRFHDLMQGLAGDADAIGASLAPVADLLDTTRGTLAEVRRPLSDTLRGLQPLAAQLEGGRGDLDRVINRLPRTLRALDRTSSYGSWFNFYICGIDLNVSLLDGTVPLRGLSVAANERDTVCGGGIE
ncbi:MlaD family protein [Nocardioides sp. LML1-1-1.1]|uniref:MlaD family protein n=1 Tax=Nocardioides sp. LML1-1-1.1 TaxID=3135248 RepID=UPI003436F3B4